MVDVQAILYASLSASLLSAFLAMLGRQWLNRYMSTDVRGSAIDRSQNRQRKLDGIVGWYFDSVMQSLPLMLQIALLLLGCALSRYLWEISSIIASVVLGVTSFGFLFYLFILLVGTVWKSCPYQTPGSTFFRYLGPRIPIIIHSAVSATGNILKVSKVVEFVIYMWGELEWWGWWFGPFFFLVTVGVVPFMLAVDVYRLGRVAVRKLSVVAHHLSCGAYTWLRSSPRGLDLRAAALDLRCILWTLQTSLDKLVHLSTLQHLITITDFPDFDSNLVIDCFNIFVGCISATNDKVKITQGLEQLATLSVTCLLRTLRHLSATRPTSSTLEDLRRRFIGVFSSATDFRGLPFYHTITKIQALIDQSWIPRSISWTDYRPSNQELIPFASHMVEAAREEYQQTLNNRVPRWILRFALHFLSRDPPPPASVIADCLTIIAIALDNDPSNTPISNERCVWSLL
jgi:hypothetical protein